MTISRCRTVCLLVCLLVCIVLMHDVTCLSVHPSFCVPAYLLLFGFSDVSCNLFMCVYTHAVIVCDTGERNR